MCSCHRQRRQHHLLLKLLDQCKNHCRCLRRLMQQRFSDWLVCCQKNQIRLDFDGFVATVSLNSDFGSDHCLDGCPSSCEMRSGNRCLGLLLHFRHQLLLQRAELLLMVTGDLELPYRCYCLKQHHQNYYYYHKQQQQPN